MSKIIPFEVNSMTKKKAIEILTTQKIEMKKKIDSLNKLLPIPFSKPSDFKTNSKKESSIKTKS